MMKILKRDGKPQPTKLQKRISGLPTHELVIYVETLLPSFGRNVVHHHRDGLVALLEAERDAETLSAVIQELKKRVPNE